MNKKLRMLMLSLGVLSLNACALLDKDEYGTPGYNYEDLVPYGSATSGPEVYQENYEGNQVKVPSSYHLSAYQSPTSFKDRDRAWVSSQSPQNYTIELANGAKPSAVAGKLFKAPKSERGAQVAYQKGQQIEYKGVYGSFKDYESAQKALEALPSDLKQGASIKSFSSVQSEVGQ